MTEPITIRNEIIEMLTPLMGSERERRALLVEAFAEPKMLATIDYTGSVMVFVPLLIVQLAEYGEIGPGKQALWRLLEVVRDRVGQDKRRRIDALRDEINIPPAKTEEELSKDAEARSDKMVGDYCMLEPISVTPGATVYRAYHKDWPGRMLALKELRSYIGESHHRNVERFLHEIELVRALKHPNIVEYIDAGRWENGVPYLVMPLYQKTLEQYVEANGPLPFDEVAHILQQVAGALQVTHKHGIIHRDIKPSNIFIDDQGSAILADFGLAFVAETSISEPRTLFGTLRYAAPEQIEGQKPDERSDVFSLGLTLYYMLTGQSPFSSNGLPLLKLRFQGALPVHPSDVYSDLPRDVGDVVMLAVRVTNDVRYATPSALAEAFGEAAQHVRLAPVYELIRQLPDQDAKDTLFDLVRRTDDKVTRELAVDALMISSQSEHWKPLPETVRTADDIQDRDNLRPERWKRRSETTRKPFEPVWIEIPAWRFLMGSDRAHVLALKEKYDGWDAAEKHEQPQYRVNLPAYRIAKYPITYAQFESFVNGNGYTNRQYWTDAGWEWRKKEKRQQPQFWGTSRWHIANHPVIGVMWYEAYAYCSWLSQQLGYKVGLPTEAQWEYAARGIDRFIYPWGNTPPDETCCNFNNNIRHTTPVGKYSPQGDSSCGCADMAGNVWEWCLTKWRNDYSGGPGEADDHAEGSAPRVLRGGSWYDDGRGVRSASRYWRSPLSYGNRFGFRCVYPMSP